MDKTRNKSPAKKLTSGTGGAELELGGPRDSHLGWNSRGYLPHFDRPGTLQAITYRLADSLPAAQIEQIEEELKIVAIDRRDGERRRRLEAWLDAGRGSCVLRDAAAAKCVIDAWRHFDGKRYDLVAWTVMPNHVHVLIRIYEGWALGKIVQSWKSYTGRRIHAAKRPGGDRGGIWMRDYWDRFIRDERHFQATVEYIHQNAVKAGLAKNAADWPFCSAAEYLGPPSSSSALRDQSACDQGGGDSGK